MQLFQPAWVHCLHRDINCIQESVALEIWYMGEWALDTWHCPIWLHIPIYRNIDDCFWHFSSIVAPPKNVFQEDRWLPLFIISMQNQEFKDHPEHFKSVGDFTLDGEGGSDIPKSSAKKKPGGKANRQQSLGRFWTNTVNTASMTLCFCIFGPTWVKRANYEIYRSQVYLWVCINRPLWVLEDLGICVWSHVDVAASRCDVYMHIVEYMCFLSCMQCWSMFWYWKYFNIISTDTYIHCICMK